ncbi:cbb3-type cytochrome oxidase subunit 3 [Sulfuriferula sp. GW1]|uniref:cbb3-type cytochrome oxidase subunit 3 n=1 Tax=Sulfuriferula sp. GW1 TaxID=3345111 RepID=UPI0039B06983
MAGTIGAIVTVVFFVIFVAIVLWAWSGRRKKDFDAAANLPFEEEDTPSRIPPKHD